MLSDVSFPASRDEVAAALGAEWADKLTADEYPTMEDVLNALGLEGDMNGGEAMPMAEAGEESMGGGDDNMM